MAKQEIKAQVTSLGGVKVKAEARGFEFIIDEPKNLGGTDEGMNPIEVLLNAIGACKIIVAKMFARHHDIKLNDIQIDMSGEFDSDGLMGTNPDAKIGYSSITTNYKIDADNTDEEIAAFLEFVDQSCPVIETIENAPTLESTIEKL